MKPETLSILTFLLSFIVYGFIGFLWLIYDSAFSLTGGSEPLVFATKIQTVVFLSVLGAIATSIVVYVIERRKP